MRHPQQSIYWLSSLCLAVALAACGGSDGNDGERGPAGPAPDVAVSGIAPGTECEQGGVRVTIGDAEPFVVCNGEDGATGASGTPGSPGAPGADGEDGLTPAVTVAPIDTEDEDSPCGEAGGVVVSVTVGEDTTQEYVCNGADGEDGEDGEDGAPGSDGEDGLTPAVTVEPIDSADEDSPCGDAGGVVVTVTVGEDTTAEYVCNGADGADGRDGASGIRVTGLDGEGEQCAGVGGILVEVLDTDGDIESTWAVCNGASGEQGEPGPAPAVSIEAASTEQCAHSGTVITIGEADPVVLCNGADGEPGATPNVTVETIAAGDEGCDNGGYALIVDDERYVLCIGGDIGDPTDPPIAVDWCAIVSPTEPATIDLDDEFAAFAQIFIDGVTGTQSTERPDGYGAQFIFGPRDTDPRDEENAEDWFAINADLNPGFDQDSAPNNDEIFAQLIWDIPGEFDFAFRVTTDAGATWTYCDTVGPDYAIENAGKLTVVPPAGDEPIVIAGWTFGEMLSGAWVDSPESLANEGTTANTDKALQIVGAAPGDYVAGTEGSAANSNGWDDGVGSKYWLVQVNATGFEQLTVSSWQRGSNTGPRDFEVEASLDGDAWQTIASVVVTNSAVGGVVENAALPASFDDASDIWIRWVVASTDRVSGTDPVSPAGTNRIDAIRVRGLPIAP